MYLKNCYFFDKLIYPYWINRLIKDNNSITPVKNLLL